MWFGCLVYLHCSKAFQCEGKFDPTAVLCVFLCFVFLLGHEGLVHFTMFLCCYQREVVFISTGSMNLIYVATNANLKQDTVEWELWSSDDPANMKVWLQESGKLVDASSASIPTGERRRHAKAEAQMREPEQGGRI